MTKQSTGTEVSACSVVGRVYELDKILRLLRAPNSHRSLVFLGAPRTGKSVLLQEVTHVHTRVEAEQRARLACVRLDCTEQGILLDGNPVRWQTLLNLIGNSVRKHNPDLYKVLSELFRSAIDLKSTQEWVEFFSKLGEIGSSEPLYVFFLLDDFDKALVSRTRYEEALEAQNLVSFATWVPSVKIIATARRRLSALPAESIWLRLLSESDARQLAKYLLKARGEPDTGLLNEVLRLAGHHPFQIRTLCDRLGEEEIERGSISAKTAKSWEHSSDITQYLKEVRDYLDSQVRDKAGLIGTRYVLGKISRGESCKGYEAEVSYLRDWAVIVKDEKGQPEIPSELLKEAVSEWLVEREQWKRTKEFDAQQFFWLTYVTALAALVCLGVVELFATDTRFKVLPVFFFLVPLLYVLATRRFIGKIRFWLNSTVVRRDSRNAS